ncbi:hypothetical protein INS17_00190 [Staphylococcus haemolyticus]|uniref:hypothetical protein n=1 Tax=Staphylococcus haemolyticus TaxID=1283 RepID=UPI00187AAA3E|nr:hypothetical protein [Staphylococcus haemolyticus]MBE7354948.1 hypothetical protein [Staphylococcus haemolyticus]
MDHVLNIGLNSGDYIALDGFDEISFYNEIPNEEWSCSGYEIQRKEMAYYNALNGLAEYNFIGIKREDTNNDLQFLEKPYVYEHYYKNIDKTDSKNEILYLKTSSISTIAVYEQWS